MQDEKPVFFCFGEDLAPGTGELEIRIRIPDDLVIIVREFHVQLSGDKDLTVDHAWCDVQGQGESSAERLHITVNGAPAPPVFAPGLFLNQITETKIPANDGRVFVIGLSAVYLPATELIRANIVRYPATARASLRLSVTGIVFPYNL